MTALLWKDFRLYRPLLILAVVLLVLPYLFGVGLSAYAEWRHGQGQWHTAYWQLLGAGSLVVSLLTFALLGSVAIAAERQQRSAEFMAYLPPTRQAVLLSKAIVAVVPGLIIWAVNLLVIYAWAPQAGAVPDAGNYAGDGNLHQMILALAATSVLLFGAGWCCSTLCASHAAAAGASLIASPTVALGMRAMEYFFGWRHLLESWYVPVAVFLGVAGFVLGVVYYLHRVEP